MRWATECTGRSSRRSGRPPVPVRRNGTPPRLPERASGRRAPCRRPVAWSSARTRRAPIRAAGRGTAADDRELPGRRGRRRGRSPGGRAPLRGFSSAPTGPLAIVDVVPGSLRTPRTVDWPGASSTTSPSRWPLPLPARGARPAPGPVRGVTDEDRDSRPEAQDSPTRRARHPAPLPPTPPLRRHAMRQFAANLSILFPTLPYLDRFRAAAEAGFRAIDLAHRLGCRKLNALAGNALSEADRPAQLGLLAESVTFAADAAAGAGMSVMLEALNPRETPRYLLPGTDIVLELIERIGRPNVHLQLDIYHVAMAGEDPLETIRRAGPRIGHVQLADMPGRHEPGTGDLPFAAILNALEAAGYSDPIGLEFVPLDPATPDFGCVRRLGGTLAAPSATGDRTAG